MASFSEKAKKAIWALRTYSISTIVRVGGRKTLVVPRLSNPTGLLDLQPLFRYATCDDLIKLKAKYPQYCLSDVPDRESLTSRGWGLKQMGTLFCAEKIHEVEPSTVLEIGAGCDTFFDKHFGDKMEYWMIDSGNYDPHGRFDAALQRRRRTKFVRGLLGSYNPELPDAYFDLVFSMSVLEHVPWEEKDDVYADMFRILKPGGWIAHSIDVVGNNAFREYDHIKRAGFILPRKPDLHICANTSKGPATLFEPLALVYLRHYGIDRPDKWTKLRSVTLHELTILATARKPGM